MWTKAKESNGEEALERARDAFHHTPSYVERFRDGRSSYVAEECRLTTTFCLGCGFWVEETHTCPQSQEVSA